MPQNARGAPGSSGQVDVRKGWGWEVWGWSPTCARNCSVLGPAPLALPSHPTQLFVPSSLSDANVREKQNLQPKLSNTCSVVVILCFFKLIFHMSGCQEAGDSVRGTGRAALPSPAGRCQDGAGSSSRLGALHQRHCFTLGPSATRGLSGK